MIPEPVRASTASAVPPAADPSEARIAFLFRNTLRQGRMHPLLHLMQQHRTAQAAARPESPGR